ncbi:MAG: acyltransferase [Bacteroidia bacterium]|nr:acyltransferase [Bacteroidota bacterium]MBP9082827.1 acyltransferase [Bacteroidia bacterium]
MSKKVYFENLDGLRFLCFLSVFFFHSFHTEYDFIKDNPVYTFIKKDLFGNGNLGVNFFFVLSGFLITFLLIEEKKLNRQIDLRNFWIRRILRIWPLFYFCVFFGFVMFPMIKEFFGQVPNETASPLMYLTFLNNFDIIRSGLPDSSVLGVLWSVAIEEQFYLLWPVILFALPVRNYWMAFAAIIVSSLFYRAMNDSPLLHEHHTLSCIGDMAIGAFGAWMISESKKFKELFENLKKYQIAIIYILFGLVFLFRDEVMFSSFPLRIFERSIIALIMLSIILEQNYAKNSLFKMSDFKRISKLGTITYGLYCLHFIGILVATTITKKLGINTELYQVLFLDTFLALGFTIFIASISYRFYETPFLKLKNKFAYITMK